MKDVLVHGRLVGHQHAPLVIPATGSGHHVLLEGATQLVRSAAASGAHVVLFQTYGTDLYHGRAPVLDGLVQRGLITGEPGSYSEYMRTRVIGGDWLRQHPEWRDDWMPAGTSWRQVLDNPEVQALLDPATGRIPLPEQQEYLRDRRRQWFGGMSRVCQESGVGLGVEVFGEDAAELEQLVANGEISVELWATASMDHHDHRHFIAREAERSARLNVPMLLSLGTRDGDSVSRAIEAASSHTDQLILMHSVSAEFAAGAAHLDELGLDQIATLATQWGLPTGFADYTADNHADVAHWAYHAGAVALKVPFRDNAVVGQGPMALAQSALPHELRQLATTLAAAGPRDESRVPPVVRTARPDPDDEFRWEHPGLRRSERDYLAIHRTVVPIDEISAGTPILVTGANRNARTGRGGAGIRAEDFVDGSAAVHDLAAGVPIAQQSIDVPAATTSNPQALQAGAPGAQVESPSSQPPSTGGQKPG